jgi:hypothetical protein
MAPSSFETPGVYDMLVVLQTVGDGNEMPLGICQGKNWNGIEQGVIGSTSDNQLICVASGPS